MFGNIGDSILAKLEEIRKLLDEIRVLLLAIVRKLHNK